MASPRPTPEAVRLSAAVDAAGQRLADLRARVERGEAEIQRAETAEALVRLQLGEALAEALGARSLAEARLRASQFDRYRAAAFAHRRPDRRNRLRRLAEKVLARLGGPGLALVGPAGVLAALGAGAALFDAEGYAAGAPGPVGPDPLGHYLVWGGDARLPPHPLFDPAFYAERNAAELARTGLTPLDHFLREGAADGRDPHPLFSLEWYVSQAPELAATGENPVLHYLRTGAAQGLSPHPLFDPAWAGSDLVGYLAEGWRAGASPHPLFDPAWRREQGLDDGASEPLARFVLTARDTLESPGPGFNSRTYAEARGGALDPSKDPLSDYLAGGAWAVLGPEGLHPALALLDDPEALRTGLTPAEALARRSAAA